ncbi:MAG: hypothetical protein JWM65_1102 [Sphingomonas bacterium]|nr:hypothetical protein [Sphingomonas bacterium]
MNAADIRRLSTFHAIATAGGISAAAIRLGKVPSAVHHDLKLLEHALGRPLFDRVGRGLRLSPAGKALANSVARAMGDLDRAYGDFAAGQEQLTPLRIAAVAGFGRYRLARRLLAAADPARRIELTFDTHDALVEALHRNAVDLVVTYRAAVSAPLRCEPVTEEEIVLVAAAGTPAIADHVAEQTRFVTYDESDYVFACWFDAVDGAQPNRMVTGDHMSELEEALAAVAAGRGLTIAPLDAVLAWGDELAIVPTSRKALNRIYLLGVGGMFEGQDADLVRRCVQPEDRSAGANAA